MNEAFLVSKVIESLLQHEHLMTEITGIYSHLPINVEAPYIHLRLQQFCKDHPAKPQRLRATILLEVTTTYKGVTSLLNIGQYIEEALLAYTRKTTGHFNFIKEMATYDQNPYGQQRTIIPINVNYFNKKEHRHVS